MMTEPIANTLALLANRAGDGRTMLGHVIVSRASQDDTVAIWHVDTEGTKTWAWAAPATVLTDAAEAQRLLAQCKRRAVIAWEPTEALKTLLMLEQTAEVQHTDWSTCAITIPDVMTEISDVRTAYRKRVADEKSTKKNVADLDWPPNLKLPLPGTAEELHDRTGFAPLVAPTAAATEALMLARLVGWLVERWHETAVALARRDYLRATFGKPTVLAPRWESRLADAYANQR